MKRREFLRNAAIVAATQTLYSSPLKGEELKASLMKGEQENLPPRGPVGELLIDSEPVLQNYAETSMGIAFSVTDWANGYVIYGEKPDLSDGRKVWCGGYRMTAMDNEVIQVRLTGLKPYTLYYYKIGADRIEYKDGYHIRITGNEEREQVYSFRTAGKEAKSHFCVINDTHAKWAAFGPAIDKVMQLQPSCVIWNGDACNTEETIAAQKRIFLKPEIERKDFAANIPYLFCPGNHDNRGLANRHLERIWMYRQPEERQPRDWDLGRNFAVRMGDIAFIGLDTGEDKLDGNPKFCNLFVSEPYRVAQQAWLRDALRQPEIKKAPYLVALCHIPLYDPRPDANPGDIYPADVDDKHKNNFAAWQRTCSKLWGPLLEKAGCQLLLAAHQHVYRLHKPNDEHKWMQIIGGGPDMSGENKKHFPTVIEGEVRDGQLVITVHNIYTGTVQETITISKRR
ncbi:MAG: metallophosphoesterase [Bacteroidaceae bacterium]|nr:metallophosphoesterase [Bacteroidaceae bacterium]